MNRYDIVIIGAGPGGYVAALYAAEFGKKVLVIEKEEPGGVCLNRGCIPTKTLIASVNALNYIKRGKEFGLDVSSYSINYNLIKQRKDAVINTLKKGIGALFKLKRIELKMGFGRIKDKGIVEVNNECFEARDIIIATGTSPLELPNLKFDKEQVLSSADVLDLEVLPKRLLIIGGGVNGCEYAYIYSSMGVEVTIVEMMDRLLPTMDGELGRCMETALKRLKVNIMTKIKLSNIPPEYDKVAVCVGRRYNTEGIGLEEVGIKTDKNRIVVDSRMRTNVRGIYAVGDVIGGYLLAHVASHEGITACNNILGKDDQMDYRSVPICIYTEPQMASVGLTEEEARIKGYNVKVSKFPFRSIGKSHAINEIEGFVKLIGNQKDEEILGIQIVGPEATELIHEAAMVVRRRMKADDITGLIHAHPTLSEALMEAAFLFKDTPIHTI